MFSKKVIFDDNRFNKIFHIENFLDQKLYDNLKKNFPIITADQIDFSKNLGKHPIDCADIKYENTEQKQAFLDFEKTIYSNKFFYFFVKKFYLNSLLNQTSFIRNFKSLRYPKIYDSKKSLFDFLLSKILFSKIKVSYQISFIGNMGGIYPHVDNNSKFLSLMLYFPTSEDNEINYGTTFWQSKNNQNQKSLSNEAGHKPTITEIDHFKSNNIPYFTSKFSFNTLVGFVSRKNSWHSVEQLNINKNYIRKSININFIIKN